MHKVGHFHFQFQLINYEISSNKFELCLCVFALRHENTVVGKKLFGGFGPFEIIMRLRTITSLSLIANDSAILAQIIVACFFLAFPNYL